MRASETAKILAAELGVAIEIADALREYDCGELEGFGDEETWRRHAEVRNAWFELGNHDMRSPGGESLNDVCRRFLPFVDDLAERWTSDENLILVAHGGVLAAALPAFVHNLTYEFVRRAPFPNTVVIEVERDSASNHWICLSWDGERMPG